MNFDKLEKLMEERRNLLETQKEIDNRLKKVEDQIREVAGEKTLSQKFEDKQTREKAFSDSIQVISGVCGRTGICGR